MLEDIIHIPILGVVPYSDIKIEDEDSVTTRFKKATKKNDINIEIIRTPHMSNFTDFNIFETQSDVSLRYVDFGESIGNPDMLIIPGTKSTVDDLKYLRETGLEEQIKECARRGKLVFGICGGYQMLGKKIVDKYGVESDNLEVEGIGLLNTVTEFEKEKTTVQTERVISDNVQGYLNDVSGKKVKGYEIHMGTTTKLDTSSSDELSKETKELFVNTPTDEVANDSEVRENMIKNNDKFCLIGCSNSEGNVVGTYLHGIFDEIDFTRTLLNTIRARKGLEPITSEVESFEEFKNREYDRLADMLRENLDMEKIYEIVKNSSK